ncbi:MAG: ROK family glucokinase [Oscillospiraceae bacterium]|nr:ROK family glucokinase [Oscillospiraceae bacterium]
MLMKYGFGVDLGGTTVKLAFFDREGNMLDKWEIPTVTADGGKQILPDIADAINGYLAQKGIDKSQVIGIGIGVPGPVDGKGVVNRCVNLGWGVFNIHEALSELTGLPVKAGNDANVAALGEAWKGGGNGCENMIMATLGTGVGGGIIINGRPVDGVHGAGGEIGHLVLEPKETEPCGCGKYGCVEQYCSATGVVRVAKRFMAAKDTESTLRGIENLTCKDVFDAGKAGDVLALEILEQVYDYMGQFLANICCVADPEIVVLGGGVSKAGQPLLDGAKRYFDKYIFHASRGIRFALASLGNDAGAYGAFKLALDCFG